MVAATMGAFVSDAIDQRAADDGIEPGQDARLVPERTAALDCPKQTLLQNVVDIGRVWGARTQEALEPWPFRRKECEQAFGRQRRWHAECNPVGRETLAQSLRPVV